MDKGTPVSFSQVEISGGFWKEKQRLFREVTIPAVYDRFSESGRMDALKCRWKEGDPFKPHIFWESDVTKWIEGASYFLEKQRDPELEEKIDELADRMEQYQDPSGYLNVFFTVVQPDKRFTYRTDHELYCLGHLIEGAIAYAHATGKEKLLQIARRYADCADRVFRIEHSAAFDTPGHPEVELALVKLYHYTGEERYKLLAEYFVDTRGTSNRDFSYIKDPRDQAYMQSHLPVREQRTIEGHSVRALYLLSGMIDLAMENGDGPLWAACDALYRNATEKRMLVVGGVGSTYLGEAFTYDYDLPEYTAYNETCASIALALASRRMWLAETDGRYADYAEAALYNTSLAGISLSGDEFFYENPLAADPEMNAFNQSRPGDRQCHLPIIRRVKLFECSCCPPNILRLVGSVGDFAYSVKGNTLYTQCYMNCSANVELEKGGVSLEQETEYPYDGRVKLTLRSDADCVIALRVPGWCRKYALKVNGEAGEFSKPEKGFIYLARQWKAGDTVTLELDMPPRVIHANPKVSNLCGRACVARGPVVYCAEGADNPYGLRALRIGDDAGRYQVEMEEICGVRMPVISTAAKLLQFEEDVLYAEGGNSFTEEVPLKLIPYAAWANRGESGMTVWMLDSGD